MSDAKLTPRQRASQIAALSAAGFSQRDIAAKLGISRSTVTRDLEDLKPTVEQAKSILDAAQARLRELMPVEKRIETYIEAVDVSLKTKQPGTTGQLLARLDAIDGLETPGDLRKAKSDQGQTVQPLFQFLAPVNIDFGGARRTPTYSNDAVIEVEPLHKTDSDRE